MKYLNLETGQSANLDGLTPEEKKFYRQALGEISRKHELAGI